MNTGLTGTASAEEKRKALESVMARHHYAGHALIEVLHTAQQLYGYLTPQLLEDIAHKLRLPASAVLGVATFYHLFRFAPCGKHSINVCMGTACYVEGSTGLLDVVRRYCVARPDWSIETGRCVGSCGLAPVVICDGSTHSRVHPAGLENLLKQNYDS